MLQVCTVIIFPPYLCSFVPPWIRPHVFLLVFHQLLPPTFFRSTNIFCWRCNTLQDIDSSESRNLSVSVSPRKTPVCSLNKQTCWRLMHEQKKLTSMVRVCLSFDIHLFEIEELSFLTFWWDFRKEASCWHRFSLLILTWLSGLDLPLRFDQWSSWCQHLVRRRWEGVLAIKATRGWINSHHLGDTRVQPPGVCTQSVMNTIVIRSNLMGCQRTDHGYTKWCWQGDRKSPGRTRRPSTFECTWYSCTHTVWALSTRRALPFWIIPVRLMTSTWFWESQTGPTEITLADGREWKYMRHMCISQSNSWFLCSILLLPVSPPLRSALFRYKWWIIWTKGGLCIQCISAHFVHDWTRQRYAVQFFCKTPTQHASFCTVSTDPNTNNQYVGWTIDGRSKKGRLKPTLYFCTLHAYLRSAYECAWIILSNIQRWTRLWSRAVLHRWSTMDGTRRQFDGTLQMVPHLHLMGGPFPRTSKWAMSKDLWIGISENFH